jgi:hypothetical protein
MKTHSLLTLWLFCALLSSAGSLSAQTQDADSDEATESDSTGLAGDHFSLEGALDLFKRCDSPEDFEKKLNSEDNFINNLDLNEDGETDFIQVIDQVDGDVHAIVLRVAVSELESQDIAVIEIEKTGAEEAVLQIIGDEDIYGEQVISEPFQEEVKKGGKGGPSGLSPRVAVVVNVWFWSPVRFMYRPGYVAYVSPWRWRAYPTWWRPWRVRPWVWYHPRVRPFAVHYRVAPMHRVVRAHAVYTPHRRSSTVVRSRTTTTVHTRKGTVKRTTTSTSVRGRNGHVEKHQTTRTKVKGNGRNAAPRQSGGRGGRGGRGRN